MTEPCGYIKLHRKSQEAWQWKRPQWWRAWSWMMLNAAWSDDSTTGLQRGQLRLSVRAVAEVWGMSRPAVHRFLTLCVKNGDIEWSKSRSRSRKQHPLREQTLETVSETVSETVYGVVTLLNYTRYQPTHNTSETVSETVSETPSTKEKNKNKNPPIVPPGGPPAKPKHAPKSREDITAMLATVDVQHFIDTYETHGLDVRQCWERFSDYVLNGSASKPFPNPSNYRDINRAFHNSCKGAIDKGMFPLRFASNATPTLPPDHYVGEIPGYWWDKIFGFYVRHMEAGS